MIDLENKVIKNIFMMTTDSIAIKIGKDSELNNIKVYSGWFRSPNRFEKILMYVHLLPKSSYVLYETDTLKYGFLMSKNISKHKDKKNVKPTCSIEICHTLATVGYYGKLYCQRHRP